MANAPKKKGMLQEVLDEIRKTIFAPKGEAGDGNSQETPALIATQEGLADKIDKRNKATKEAADNADGAGYKRGGMVKKTEKAKVHKGEMVLTTKQVSKMKKAMKNGGC